MINLHKVAGLYIVGFVGTFGSGKTLGAVAQAIRLADAYRRTIVTNTPIKQKQARRVAHKFGLKWFARYGRIKYRKTPEALMVGVSSSIILFDEVGVDLFSRGFSDKSRNPILQAFWKIRHFNNLLLYTCQDGKQIDIQLRDRTQLFVYCKALQLPFSVSLGRSTLLTRWRFYFSRDKFEFFNESQGSKLFYPLWASGYRFEFGFPSAFERAMFGCYHSQTGLSSRAKTIKKQVYEYGDLSETNCLYRNGVLVADTASLSMLRKSTTGW